MFESRNQVGNETRKRTSQDLGVHFISCCCFAVMLESMPAFAIPQMHARNGIHGIEGVVFFAALKVAADVFPGNATFPVVIS